MTENPLDTVSLSERVRHYLNYNQIQYNKFSTLVLGVSQSRLSNLLRKPKPWNILSKRVQDLYERMQLWMDTKATYGNNPYYRQKGVRESKNKKEKRVNIKKQRSLLEGDETIELLRQWEDYAASEEVMEEGFQVQEPVTEQETCLLQELVEDGEVQDIDVLDIATTMTDQIMVGQTVLHEGAIVEPGDQQQLFSVDFEDWDAFGNLMVMGESSIQGIDPDNQKVEDTMVLYQMDEVLPVCQVFVEENPEEPGTFTVVEISTEETVCN